jgi:hypothetical protein
MAKNGYQSLNWDLEGAGPSAPLQPDGDIILLPRLRETAALQADNGDQTP